MERNLLLANFAATGFLTGLIWFVQVVHYPIFRKVGPADFIPFHNAHTAWTGQVVMLPMLIELALGVWLFFRPPAVLAGWPNWAAFALVLFLWAFTFFVFVPLHGRLAQGFAAGVAQRLVALNWGRTVAWTARFALLGWALVRTVNNG